MIKTNTFKLADRCGEEASAQKNKNWRYYETKWLVKIWADEIQRQLSAMGRKQNIWENIAQNLLRLSITCGLKNSKLNGHMCFSLPSSKCSAAPLSFRLCCLNFAQRFASISAPSVGISRKLGGAAENLIDSSEKCICRLSFELLSLHVIESRSNDNGYKRTASQCKIKIHNHA